MSPASTTFSPGRPAIPLESISVWAIRASIPANTRWWMCFPASEADAALIVASDPVASLPGKAARRLAEIPTIALDTHESETTRIAKVAFTTATAGIHVEGTVYRMDNIPIRLRKVLPSPYPSDEEVLSRLLARVKELKAC